MRACKYWNALLQIANAWKHRISLNPNDATSYIKELVALRMKNNLREEKGEQGPDVFDPVPEDNDFDGEVQHLVEGATQSHVCHCLCSKQL